MTQSPRKHREGANNCVMNNKENTKGKYMVDIQHSFKFDIGFYRLNTKDQLFDWLKQCILLIFLIATVQISIECEIQEC